MARLRPRKRVWIPDFCPHVSLCARRRVPWAGHNQYPSAALGLRKH
jgi:hypothetical protein